MGNGESYLGVEKGEDGVFRYTGDPAAPRYTGAQTVPVVSGDSTSAESLRFELGTQVLCLTGPAYWSAGTIIKLNYSEPSWTSGRTVPYQVQLDDGRRIYVPRDSDMCCKALTVTWWHPVLFKPGSGYVDNPTVSATAFQGACVGRDVNERNHRAETALLEAVRLNWSAGVEALLQMGADANAVDEKKASALHRAYIHGTSMISLLVERQANPNFQDSNPDYDPRFTSKSFGDRLQHQTPMHYSCIDGNLEAARLLLQGRGDLNIQDAKFKAPLHLAIEEGHEAIIDFLLQSGAVVDLCTLESGKQNSPLMDAARTGEPELAGKLIRAGADVNKAGKQGMTALHLAARRGDPILVQMLLEARADATLESKNGTALYLARKKGSTGLLQLFGIEEDVKPVANSDYALRAALYID